MLWGETDTVGLRRGGVVRRRLRRSYDMMMRTLTAWTGLTGLGSLALLAGGVQAEITTIGAQLDQQTMTEVQFSGGFVRDEAFEDLGLNLGQDNGFDFQWSDAVETGTDLGAQRTRVRTDTALTTSASGVSFMTDFFGRVDSVNGTQSSAEHRTSFSSTMSFDEGTVVDIVLRLEWAGFPDSAQVMSELQFEGLSGGPLMLQLDGNDGQTLELVTRRTIDNGGLMRLSAELDTFFDANDDDGVEVEFLQLTASVTVVPAPAGLALLAPAGLMTARRRR